MTRIADAVTRPVDTQPIDTQPIAVPAVVAHDLDAELLGALFPEGIPSGGRRIVDAHGDVAGLRDAEVLITGWGSRSLTPDVMAQAPKLKLVVHTGGSVREIFPKELYAAGLRVSGQAAANAPMVADFTTSMIVLALKGAFSYRERYRRERTRPEGLVFDPAVGLRGRRVGVVSASLIGRLVIADLRRLGLEVALYDPFVSAEEARDLGVRSVGDVVELASSVDVLSIHAPLLPETTHMIDAAVLAALPDGAMVVNTARGAVIDEEALIAELSSGRLSAALDVTQAEPPAMDSPLWTLPNVFLTPHLAGALGSDVALLGQAASGEVDRWFAGQSLANEIVAESYDIRA